MECFELPIIINGQIFNCKKNIKNNYIFKFDEVEVRLPRLEKDEIADKVGSIFNECRHLSTDDIINFITNLAKLWGNPEYHYRKLLLKLGPRITGQSKEMYEHNLGLIIDLIYFKEFLSDIIECELGSKRILDDWVETYNANIHAEPLGNLLHIVAGNVPLAGVYSLIRGILTKNINIMKLPSRELVTTLLFALSFYDADPNHPITKNTTVMYWSRSDDDIIDYMCSIADGMCLWGGEKSVAVYKSKCPLGTEIVEYGPRSSLHIVQWDSTSKKDLPLRIARDVCVYEQEACLSPQIVYVKGNASDLAKRISQCLKIYLNFWPNSKKSFDHYAHMNYVKLSNIFIGNDVYCDDELSWMVINVKSLDEIKISHPLGRTIFLVQIDDFEKCISGLPENVQTIGIEPEELKYTLRDALSLAGVKRIANVGYVDAPRLGSVHDGKYLTRLVKIVSMEKDVSYKCKKYDMSDDYLAIGLFRKEPDFSDVAKE